MIIEPLNRTRRNMQNSKIFFASKGIQVRSYENNKITLCLSFMRISSIYFLIWSKRQMQMHMSVLNGLDCIQPSLSIRKSSILPLRFGLVHNSIFAKVLCFLLSHKRSCTITSQLQFQSSDSRGDPPLKWCYN